MRGFSGGAMAGVAVGAAALAGLSLLAPPEAGPGEIGVVAGVAAEAEAISPAMPVAETAPEAVAEPDVAAVAESPAGAEEPVATEPEPTPDAEPVTPQVVMMEPDEVADPAPLDVAEADADAPAGEVPALVDAADEPSAESPVPEAEVANSEPASDAPPLLAEEPVATLEPPPGPAAPEEPEQVATVPQEAEPVAEAVPLAPLPETTTPEPGLVQAAEPAPPGQAETTAPEPDLAQAAEPAPPEEAEVAPVDEPPSGPLVEAPPAGGAEVASVASSDEPALPGRVTVGGRSLPGSGAVRVNRPGAEEQPVPEAVVEEAEPGAEVLPAVRRFAAAWEAPAEARPLMSLVLLDDGATDPAAVAALPWPVSVALDPSREGAAERLAGYRAQGIEALVLAELPAAAQPVDVEAVLGAALDALPETVAVLDLGQGGLGGRDATAQMAMSRVARDGRGLVLGDQGLRSGLDLAGREGVPAAEVLRDLDGEGQDGAAIRRGLDDAVRRAGQEGQAVVVARVAPGTLAALGEWSLEGRAQEVTVAPVSAVLGVE